MHWRNGSWIAALALVAMSAALTVSTAQPLRPPGEIPGGLFRPPMAAPAPDDDDRMEERRDIPDPTTEDVDPGQMRGSADAIAPQFRRQMVEFSSSEPVGTLVVDVPQRFLYLVNAPGSAIRYGIRVGRDGFTWQGAQRVSRKAEWPDWTPPAEMIERQPYLPRWMAGGEGNPMGARALYLGNTLFRIHGTNAPETIGHAVSSGCFGMLNSDIEDLYDRVPVGTRVVVRR